MNIENILIFLGIIALFLLEGFLEVALLSVIGAFTRRTIGTKQKSFKEYYKENALLNSIIGFITIVIAFIAIVGISRLVIG